jgi:hypothetical protein
MRLDCCSGPGSLAKQTRPVLSRRVACKWHRNVLHKEIVDRLRVSPPPLHQPPPPFIAVGINETGLIEKGSGPKIWRELAAAGSVRTTPMAHRLQNRAFRRTGPASWFPSF